MKTFKLTIFYIHLIYLNLFLVGLFSGFTMLAFVGSSTSLFLLLPFPIGIFLSLHSLLTGRHIDSGWERILTLLPLFNLLLLLLLAALPYFR